MKKNKTQLERVRAKLEDQGYVDNFWAINNYILRLSHYILLLRKEGYNIRTEFVNEVGSKNCHYYLMK